MSPQTYADRLNTLRGAFSSEGFDVSSDDIAPEGLRNGRIGLIAKHRVAKNYETKEAKRVYFMEGSHDDMGFLMGYLAKDKIAQMTHDYIDHSIWEMITGSPPGEHSHSEDSAEARLHAELIDVVSNLMDYGQVAQDTPEGLVAELTAIHDGCNAKGADGSPSLDELWVLNAGFDCLLAYLYAFRLPVLRKPKMRKLLLESIGCNALALINGAAERGPLFGRDFMFPTGRVFQDTACLTIYNPLPRHKSGPLPMVAMNAPGMVGSIAAMNINGVAAGVDVIRGANSNPDRLGVNSLMLVRHAIENGPSIEKAVDQIVGSRRGVTWLYPLASPGNDGNGQACVVEAGMTQDTIDFLDYPRRFAQKVVPKQSFLDRHHSVIQRQGAMVRWEGFVYPGAYIRKFNRRMAKWYGRRFPKGAFKRMGYVNRTIHDVDYPGWPIHEKNCPSAYYFAPLRALKNKVVIATNHCVCPEMRLCTMDWWTSKLSGGAADDSQWRYDELNHRTLRRLGEGPITYDDAKDLIDFLNPDGDYPQYYEKKPKSLDGKRTIIGGSVSLFDLKQRTIESCFGYYGDDWIKLTLPNYIIPE